LHYLLFVFAFLWFAFIAPLKVTLAVVLSLLIVTSVVKATANAVLGESSYSESFKSIAFSFIFLGIALFTLLGFSKGAGVNGFSGLSGIAVLGGFLTAYILGFKVGLGASFGASAIVALVSTVVSGMLFYAFKSLL
jgi:hypothetical protein